MESNRQRESTYSDVTSKKKLVKKIKCLHIFNQHHKIDDLKVINLVYLFSYETTDPQ